MAPNARHMRGYPPLVRYFVTGATGFIGGALARQLRAEGHEVRALVRDVQRAANLRALGCELVLGDVRDTATMRPAMEGVDGVFHLAAWYEIGVDEPAATAINVDGTRNVLGLMRQLAIPRGVYTSTVAVFSDTHGELVDENYRHDGAMLNVYERTKHEAHYDVALPMIREGLPLVVVMPGVVYGPGDPSAMGDALRSFLRGRLPAVPQGTQYCWAHVEDTARGHVLAMERGTVGESYIIAGEPRELSEVLDLAARWMNVPRARVRVPAGVLRGAARLMQHVERVLPIPPAYRAETLRTTAGTTAIASSAKARRELGFDPRPLEVGLRDTLAREHQKL